MLGNVQAFSGFAVDDIAKARQFYGETLGVSIEETPMGLELRLAGGAQIFVYSKSDFEPATYTILNFVVEDIDKAVDGLVAAGVAFEHYPANQSGIPATDEKGVLRNDDPSRGPLGIAWFKDPAGNILSVLQQ